MSFRSIVVLLGICAIQNGTAQNVVNEHTARVIAYWEPGDVRQYDVHRVKEGRKAGNSTFRISFKVLDGTDSTYTIECRYHDLKVDAEMPDDARSKELMGRLMKAADGMRVVCTTDETGIPLALVNEQEVAEHVRGVLSGVLDMATSDQERVQMERAFRAVLNTQVLAQSALEDIGNLLFAFGVEYELGRTERVSAKVPNPLGGSALDAVQEFTMTKLDPKKSTAHMRMNQHIDPKGMEEGLDRLVREMGEEGMSAEKKTEIREVLKTMKVDDTMELEIDLRGAWTKSAKLVRTVEVMGVQEVDTRTYTLR